MRKTISFVLALFLAAGTYAQTLTQYEELIQVKTNNGKSKELNVRVSDTAPVHYILPEDYAKGKIVEQEVETFYSGKKTLRMQQAEDGGYILVDPERCTYTLEGLVKSDFTSRDIVSDETLAAHTASFIKNANPVTDADGDWDFFELKQVGVFGFEANDTVDLYTCHFNYIFLLEQDGKHGPQGD